VQNYKNTAEGRTAARKYADIIALTRPEVPENRPRMALSDRAKIFSPFAALRGYEGKIAEEERRVQRQIWQELSEEERGNLSQQLSGVCRGMSVELLYFLPECTDASGRCLGTYCRLRGVVERIDPLEKILRIGNATVAFRWIREIDVPKR